MKILGIKQRLSEVCCSLRSSLKARLVADVRMQDRSASQDNSSPTVSTESLFLLSTVFAYERRHVVTIDIEGAYMGYDK